MRAGRGKQGRGDRPAVRGLVSWVESGELAVEVSLNGGGDEGGRLFGWDGRDCADLPDVAHHGQTDNLAGGERRSDESLVVVESGWDGVEDGTAKLVARRCNAIASCAAVRIVATNPGRTDHAALQPHPAPRGVQAGGATPRRGRKPQRPSSQRREPRPCPVRDAGHPYFSRNTLHHGPDTYVELHQVNRSAQSERLR